ncbi:MAG: hypothetical protein O3A21_08455 [Proteobacteria bacterium]|nr:hypothetical protein [Pseudomonadota bacterium]
MSTQTLFEVLTLKNGQWVVDSTYPEREEAIEVARGLHGEKQYDGVRVNRDSYDGNSGSSRETIVYDSTKQVKAAPIPTATNEAAPPRPSRRHGPAAKIQLSR